MSAAVDFGFFDQVVVIGEARDLRKVCDAEKLVGCGELLEAAADGFRGGSADAGVDFIEDKGAQGLRAARFRGSRHDAGFESEGEAGEFAAAGDFVERTEFLAAVGGDEELDAIHAAGAPFGGGEINAEIGAFHGEGGEFLADRFFQCLRGVSALAGEARGGLFVRGGEIVELLLELGAAFGGGLEGFEFRGDVAAEGDDLIERGAILAFELVEFGEARFDVIETARIGFERAEVMAEGVGGFLDGDFGGAQRFKCFRERGVDAEELLDAFAGLGDLGERGGGGVVEQLDGGGGVFLEARDVGQYAALGFELGVLAGLDACLLDFGFLEAPEVGEAEVLLFAAVEFGEFEAALTPLRVEGSDLIEGR